MNNTSRHRASEINVAQALLGVVWGTWFALSGVSILSAEALRPWIPWFAVLDPGGQAAFMIVLKILFAFLTLSSVVGVGVVLRVYQDIGRLEAPENAPGSTMARTLVMTARQLMGWLLFTVVLAPPIAASLLFQDVNPYQLVLGAVLFGILLWYLSWERGLSVETTEQETAK